MCCGRLGRGDNARHLGVLSSKQQEQQGVLSRKVGAGRHAALPEQFGTHPRFPGYGEPLLYCLPLLAALFAPGCTPSQSVESNRAADRTTVTFCQHVAPILYDHCATCHRPGGNAPFSLLTYQDVKHRAQLIGDLTQRRVMPPWLPEVGRGEFAGQRRLSDEQIAILEDWIEQGTAEGDTADLPALPSWKSGWQLGEPDLVLMMSQPFAMPADGPDVYRNFVFPGPVTGSHHVRAWEFDPGGSFAVHHAFVAKDRSGTARRRAAADPGPGYESMELTGNLEGHFNGWAPGKVPYAGTRDMAWLIDDKTDIVIQLHLQPQGKREEIQVKLGLYFADQPPTRFPAVLLLGSLDIDIPANNGQYIVTDELTLPADVDVLGVVPHAHYLATDMKGKATLPDGTTEWLFHIPRWNFNWQSAYRYRHPFFLPRGTQLSLTYTYDNSSGNSFNPHHPPQRVAYGPNTSDEMCELWIQVVPRHPEDLGALHGATQRKMRDNSFALWQSNLLKNPKDWHAHNAMGLFLLKQRRLAEAAEYFEKVVLLAPERTDGYFNLGYTRTEQGQADKAIEHYKTAISLQPRSADAHLNLAALYRREKQLALCVDQLEEAVRLRPQQIDWRFDLGRDLLKLGAVERAVEHFHHGLKLDPTHPGAHYELGLVLFEQERFSEARHHFQEAIAGNANDLPARFNLGRVFELTDQPRAALDCYAHIVRIEPGFAPAHVRSGIVLLNSGKLETALQHFLKTMKLEPGWSTPANGAAWILATHPSSETRKPDLAIRIAQDLAVRTNHRVPGILDTLAAAHASAGDYPEAVRIAKLALDLAATSARPELAQRIGRRLELYRRETPFRHSQSSVVDIRVPAP